MSIEANKAIVLRFNREFLEQNNTEVLKEIVHTDFTNHTAPGTFPKNAEGLVGFIGMLHSGFSDITIEIHEMIGENDIVCTRKTIHAKHTGEIMGHAPTGKQVAMNVMDMVRIKDEQYIDHWGRNDVMQVIASL